MLSRKILVVIISMVFAAVIIACENDVQEIKGTVAITQSKTQPVASVTAAITSNGEYVVITWDAVVDVVNYNVIVQQENSIGLTPFSSFAGAGYTGPQCVSKFSNADGSQSPNENWNRYSARIVTANVRSGAFTGKRYRFGVYSSRITTDKDGMSPISSDVTWSNYIMF